MAADYRNKSYLARVDVPLSSQPHQRLPCRQGRALLNCSANGIVGRHT